MKDKKVYLRLFKIVKKYIRKIILLIILLIIGVGIQLASPLLQKVLLDDGFLKADFKTILLIILLLFFLAQGNSFISLIIEKIRVNLVSDFRFRLEGMSFYHLLKVRTDFFSKVNQSELLSQLDIDINYMCSILGTNTLSCVSSIFTLIGGMVSIFVLDVRLAILFIVTLPFKCLIIHYHSKLQKKKLNFLLDKSKKYARWFSEFVTGIITIRIFGIHKNKQNEFENFVNDKISSQKDLEMLTYYRRFADSFFNDIWDLLIYLVGGFMIVKGELSIGSLFAFISYSSFVTIPLFSIFNIKLIFTGVLPSATRFFEFLDIEEEIINEDDNTEFKTSEITFQNTGFAYEKKSESENAVFNYNFKIKENFKIALIGMNGSGKSTIMNLLFRLYDYDTGRILYDNVDIKNINLLNYRSQFSIVSQNIYLFDDTIKNNICLYKDYDDKMLSTVLEDCGLTEFIKEKGLNYNVGLNGAYLSGGQRQKIALARALLHDRPIFIFDEPTSNTDLMFENLFHKIIFERLRDKTVIIITHRLEILKEVDSIVLLEDGKSICQDSYDNLMENNTKFMKIINKFI